MSAASRSAANRALPPAVRRGTPVRLAGGAPADVVQLTAIAETVQLDTSSRTITGTVTVYDTPSTSQGIVIHDGALTAREPLERVKLLRDHNMADPVGYATSIDLSAGARSATFYVPEGENGDRALQEATDHLRDGLSIGFAVKQYAYDDAFNLHVYEGELYEVSLCAVPDFSDAQVTDVAAAVTTQEGTSMNRAQLAAALAAGTITQETHDRQVARLDEADRARGAALAAGTPTPAPVADGQSVPRVDPALAAGPETVPAAPAPASAFTRNRGLSLDQMTRRLAAAFNSGDSLQIQLAIADVVPTDDAGQGFIGREDWVGEVWAASDETRRWINAIGAPVQLTALKMKGWRWDVLPKPARYAGSKAEVPTNKPKTVPWEATAGRWAGGWDIDRVFIDFADVDYLKAFWDAAVRQYQVDSDADVAAAVIAAGEAWATANAIDPLPHSTTVPAMIKTALRGHRVAGGRINRIFMASDLFDEFLDFGTDNLPLWLAKANIGVSAPDGGANVDDLLIADDPALADGELSAFDSRALEVREKTPIQVTAPDVAHAGVDLGFYSYGGTIVKDPRLVNLLTRAA